MPIKNKSKKPIFINQLYFFSNSIPTQIDDWFEGSFIEHGLQNSNFDEAGVFFTSYLYMQGNRFSKIIKIINYKPEQLTFALTAGDFVAWFRLDSNNTLKELLKLKDAYMASSISLDTLDELEESILKSRRNSAFLKNKAIKSHIELALKQLEENRKVLESIKAEISQNILNKYSS